MTQLQINLFERYYFELIKWNARINLTSVTSWINVQTKHFLDSLTVSLAIPEIMLESGRFVDIGTGGGFPGMPLKIVFPKLNATLIDSTAKKTAFLKTLNDTLQTSDVNVLTGRSEIFAHETELRENFAENRDREHGKNFHENLSKFASNESHCTNGVRQI